MSETQKITHTLEYGEPPVAEDERTVAVMLSVAELDLIEAALDHYQSVELLRGTAMDSDEPCDVGALRRSFDLQAHLAGVC